MHESNNVSTKVEKQKSHTHYAIRKGCDVSIECFAGKLSTFHFCNFLFFIWWWVMVVEGNVIFFGEVDGEREREREMGGEGVGERKRERRSGGTKKIKKI